MPEDKPEEKLEEEHIEREMFEARQSLEENLDKFVHKVRETTSIRAKVDHAVASKAPKTLIVAALAGAGLALLLHRRHG